MELKIVYSKQYQKSTPKYYANFKSVSYFFIGIHTLISTIFFLLKHVIFKKSNVMGSLCCIFSSNYFYGTFKQIPIVRSESDNEIHESAIRALNFFE